LQWLFETNDNTAFVGVVQQQVSPIELIDFAQQYRAYQRGYEEQVLLESKESSKVLSMSDWFCQLQEEDQSQFPLLLGVIEWLVQLKHAVGQLYPHEIIDKVIAEGYIDGLFKEHHLEGQLESLDLFQQVLSQWATGGSVQFSAGEGSAIKVERKPVSMVLACLRYAQQLNQLESSWADMENTEINAVRILTLHAAKGLEFPVVFYAGVEAHRFRSDDGLLTFEPQCHPKNGFGLVLNQWQGQPTLKSIWCKQLWQKPRQEQDKLRLMYVALTRAKQELFVTVGAKSFAYWQPQFFAGVVQHPVV
jgi:superfamily I DNA/RNA helicase